MIWSLPAPNMSMTATQETQPLILKPEPSAVDVTSEQDRLLWRNIRNLLTANSIAVLAAIAGMLYDLTIAQFVYARLSAQLFGMNFSAPTERPCFLNTSVPGHDKVSQVQSLASSKMMTFRLALTLPSLFTTIVIGAYSDHLGRRFLFLTPAFGFFCRSAVAGLVMLLNLHLNWMFVGILIHALCGGLSTTILAISAYTADNTPASHLRTVGLAISEAGLGLAMIIGMLGGGYFIQLTGFFYPFLTTTVLALLNIVLIATCLENTIPARLGWRSFRQWPSPSQAIRDVFGFYLLKSNTTMSGSTEGSPIDWNGIEHGQKSSDRRLEYCLGIVVFAFAALQEMGMVNVNILYVMNEPFCWDSKTIGNYNSVKGILQRVLSVLVLKLLGDCVREEWVGVMGFLSMGGSYLILAFASHGWMLYLAPVVGLLSSLAITVVRSLMSQRAPSNKQGSLLAGLAVMETACSAVGGVLFNSVYGATVSVMRNATYLLTTALSLLAVLFMGAYIHVIK